MQNKPFHTIYTIKSGEISTPMWVKITSYITHPHLIKFISASTQNSITSNMEMISTKSRNVGNKFCRIVLNKTHRNLMWINKILLHQNWKYISSEHKSRNSRKSDQSYSNIIIYRHHPHLNTNHTWLITTRATLYYIYQEFWWEI